jgi:hypothetical protein
MLMKRPTSSTHQQTAPLMIPDPCGKVPPHAPRNSSGEIAADHVLHVQRFTLPLGLNTPPKPRLGRHPPPAAMLTSEHHPPPTSTTWPSGRRSWADRARSNAWSRSCSNRARSASGKAARISSTRSGRPGPPTDPVTRKSRLLRVQTSLSRRSVTEPARASLHAVLVAARQAHHRAGVLPQSTWPLRDSDDSVGIRPNTIQHR